MTQASIIFLSKGEKMHALEALVTRVAETDSPVLIRGEAGTGKELVARTIHDLSHRARGPWQKLNCASLPPDLLESELFGRELDTPGHDKATRPGRIELAHGGTLLLMEVADLPAALQLRLLNVLREKQLFRTGGRDLIAVDIRALATTSRDPRRAGEHGLLHADLRQFLGVVELQVPPLRERREDIPAIVEHFRRRFAEEFKRPEPALPSQLLELCTEYDWPGNIRELEATVKRWVVLGDADQVRDDLKCRMRKRVPAVPARTDLGPGLREIGRRAAREAEQAALREALQRVGGNRAAAARLLKVSYKTLLQKLSEGEPGSDRPS